MENTNTHSDLAEFFDFGEAAMPDVIHHQPETPIPVSQGINSSCPAHGTDSTDGCLCHGFLGDFETSEAVAQEPHKDEWNPDFSSWIPRYSKPEHACDYCRSRHLECFITYEGQSACSPCSALFRPCSFSAPSAEPSRRVRHVMDTLDIVSEDAAHISGGLTGKSRALRSLGHTGPIEHDDDAENKSLKKGGIRFPRSAIKILKEWMEEHIDHPYPTEDDKIALKEKTGLTSSQISNWMANTRRRQKTRPKRTSSPSIRPTEAINIPSGRTWESLNPFERWKHSPPENEPAPMTAIAKAVENFDPPEPISLSSSLEIHGGKGKSNGSSGSFSVFRAPSATSLETGATNISSGSMNSLRSAWSYGSRNSRNSFNTFDSFGSNPTKERRRRRRVPTRPSRNNSDSADSRPFQCTFCTDTFKSKYDWSRHEKSLHLSLEKWICAPLGDVITCTSSGQRKCTYCDALDPTSDHLEAHNHASCEEKGLESRTFYRKDHLRQHLRLIHNCKMTPSMETWKSEATFVRCRCGFCGAQFTRWQDRVDHLAKEFRNGAKMKDWKGCRGLDPNVAALVTNSMPPYLIGNESRSPFPFSASNTASMKHGSDIYLCGEGTDLEYTIPNSNSRAGTSNANSSPHSTNATCWEILTLGLGRFVRQKMETEGPAGCTDEMLQNEARRIIYGTDDSWNQTEADNPEWLSLFKKAHGLVEVPGDYDLLGDLEDLGVTGGIAAMDQANMDHYNMMGLNRWNDAIAANVHANNVKGKSKTHYGQTSPPTAATCWEILTLRLGRFVRQKMETEGPAGCKDEILQAEARRILYDDDDSWNQTAADNPEWLALFKKAHGIVDVPANYDALGDLEDLGVMGGISAMDQAALDQYNQIGVAKWGSVIPTSNINGKDEPLLDGNAEMPLDLGLGTVYECFKNPGWGQIAEMDCGGAEVEPSPQIVDGDLGELQLFNWDEGMDGAVFNMGCGA